MISFLSRTIDFFFFFLSLWSYLWLAETSQQPISQTTWLKVTPHCNHCNHWRWFLRTMWPMSWWRWTCSERDACSFILPRPSSLWAEETFFLSVYTLFWGLFSSPTLFAATGQQPTCSWFPFLAEEYTISFSFWAYGFICGWPRPVSSRSVKQPGWRSSPFVTNVTIMDFLLTARADQLNSLAEDPPPRHVTDLEVTDSRTKYSNGDSSKSKRVKFFLEVNVELTVPKYIPGLYSNSNVSSQQLFSINTRNRLCKKSYPHKSCDTQWTIHKLLAFSLAGSHQ